VRAGSTVPGRDATIPAVMRRTDLAWIVCCVALSNCTAPPPATELREPAPAIREQLPPASPAPPAASPASLFPLVAGARYHFRSVFHGRPLDGWTVVRVAPVADQALYYFIQEDDEREGGKLIASDNIGGGLYTSRGDGVYVGPLSFLDQVPSFRPDSIQLMVALPPKVKARTVVEISPEQRWSREYVVDAIETVEVPAGTFPGSVCVTFTDHMDLEGGEEAVVQLNPVHRVVEAVAEHLRDRVTQRARAWLAPGVGLVRWERATGRVDELVSYEIPR
jgi:hypothetical protein